MKTLLLKAIAICAILLPATQAGAKNGYPFGDTGRLGKSATGKPRTLALDFAKAEVKAGVTTSYRVHYSFVK